MRGVLVAAVSKHAHPPREVERHYDSDASFTGEVGEVYRDRVGCCFEAALQ